MGARGRFRRPLDPSRAERRPRNNISYRLAGVRSALCSSQIPPCEVRTSRCAVCGRFICIDMVQRREPPFAAAYASLAYWRNSTKSSSPPFESARPSGFSRFCGNLALRTLQCSPRTRLRVSVLRVWKFLCRVNATAPPFTAKQGLASATGTRALPPRDPGFASFPGKRSKIRKANNL